MARIPETLRLGIIDSHVTHYTEADALNGSPILLVLGYGVVQLQAQRTTYQTLGTAIIQLEDNDLPTLRAERDAIWGIAPDDEDGVWFRLSQYKTLVRARLGAKHPLSRTVPNLGQPTIGRYLTIMQQFIDHWERVNAALPSPLTLGTFTLASLQTALTNLSTKIIGVESADTSWAIKRAEREQLFGDEPEDMREETSIIARLLLYQATLRAMFPNQPIADSLPDIFPADSPVSLPSFNFNWVTQPGSLVKLWYSPPSPALTAAALVFLKEGVTELTSPVTSTTPGTTPVHNFSGVTVTGELDQLELRDGDGITIAEGTRNTALAEPT
jgi:hypothetical protein